MPYLVAAGRPIESAGRRVRLFPPTMTMFDPLPPFGAPRQTGVGPSVEPSLALYAVATDGRDAGPQQTANWPFR